MMSMDERQKLNELIQSKKLGWERGGVIVEYDRSPGGGWYASPCVRTPSKEQMALLFQIAAELVLLGVRVGGRIEGNWPNLSLDF